MRKYFQILVMFTLLLTGCKRAIHNNESISDSKSKPLSINNDFRIAIDSYIKENPIKLPVKKFIFKNGYSYPSYHVYFKRKGKDTIMSIVQFPHLQSYDIDGKNISKDEIVYDSISPDGYFLYKEEYPIIIFNSNKNYNLEVELNSSIPDSLKLNEQNFHIQYSRRNFKIENGKIGDIIEQLFQPNTTINSNSFWVAVLFSQALCL